MNLQKRTEIKQLVRQVFWQTEDLSDKEMTANLLRRFLMKNVHPDVIDATGITISGRFWEKVEKLCWMAIETRKWMQ